MDAKTLSIETFTPSIALLPVTLQPAVRRSIEQLVTAWPTHEANRLIDQQEALVKVFAMSDFVAKTCIRSPQSLINLLRTGDFTQTYPVSFYADRLQSKVDTIDAFDQLSQVLRQFRYREMLRIAWRDLLGLADVAETLMDLSHLAQACVRIGVDKLYAWQAVTDGYPREASGESMPLIVIAMGKLGAAELNFSSDIDLICTFAQEGNTQGGARGYTHSQFFIRLSQQLIKLLDTVTADGFVFRVDMRLRPFGNSGQLAVSVDGLLAYYEKQGREWERYALIKARCITGDPVVTDHLMTQLRPFIYRRYLDYNVFESLREMKQMIRNEEKRKGVIDNIKLGSGGIREIEFIAQVFQLVYGGREPRLQKPPLLPVLETLGSLGHIPQYAVQKLTTAYLFLRRTENHLQAMNDQQIHILPNDTLKRLPLAFSMGYENWDEFKAQLDQHMRYVSEYFSQLFAAPQMTTTQTSPQDYYHDIKSIWLEMSTADEAVAKLTEIGFDDAELAYQQLQYFKKNVIRALSQRGLQRLEDLIPWVIVAVAQVDNRHECLKRVLKLLESVAKRTAYLALLCEQPLVLSQLVKLFSKSSWIADLVARFPILLDELLNISPRIYQANVERLTVELENVMRDTALDDTERQMEHLRQFRRGYALRVAAAELTGVLPVAKVSDVLTAVAETIINKVVSLVALQLKQRHGNPCFELTGELHEAGFAVIAFGKMGGYELGFDSDVDLVFLHNTQGEKQLTRGEKVIDNTVYFVRLGQRIIHYLSTATPDGILYEVDVRLRPSGRSGLLVSSLAGFATYQENQAWTWEHQALIRARGVAGDSKIIESFASIRRKIIGKQRDNGKLQHDVRDMRERMRAELNKNKPHVFDLKQGQGGITDIEFIVQYLVLRWAYQYPQLTDFTDNLRILESLAKANILPEADANLLADAYMAYRHRVHELSLQRESALVANTEFRQMRDEVKRIWNEYLAA